MIAVLETDRLILRELTEADAGFVLRLLNEPSFLRFIGDRGVRDLQGARDYVRDRFTEHYRAHGFGLYAVVGKGHTEPLGICGLLKRDALDDADLGFAFLPEHWRRGYALEAAAAVLAYARDELELERVVAVTLPENVASVTLLRKLGFRVEGPARLPEQDAELQLHALRLNSSRRPPRG